MEKIKSQIILITFVTIVSTVLLCVVPQGKMRNAFKLLCAVVIIYSVVSPLVNFDFDSLDFDSLLDFSSESESFSDEADNAALIAANEGYSDAAEKLLLKNNLKVSRIESECAIRGETIVLEKMTVYCNYNKSEKSQAEKVLAELKNENTEIEFVIGESDED